MPQRREHAAHLLLILGYAVKLFGRRGGAEKRKQPFILVPSLLTPEFVNRASYACAVKPAGWILVMRPGAAHELPENIRCQFFRAAGIMDDSGNDPGDPWIVEMKQMARIRTSGWGDNIR